MHSIGDIVCADIYIGIIYNIDKEIVTLNCHDGQQHNFNINNIIPITKADKLVGMFEGGIINAGSLEDR